MSSVFFLSSSAPHRDLHSFPTRRSSDLLHAVPRGQARQGVTELGENPLPVRASGFVGAGGYTRRSGLSWEGRSEEHTSELQSRFDLVCRLLLEKKNNKQNKLAPVLMR